MIAKLKSKEVRTVFEKRVVRLTVDIPYRTLKDASIEDKHAMKYLDQRVGKHLGVDVTALESQDQDVVDEHL